MTVQCSVAYHHPIGIENELAMNFKLTVRLELDDAGGLSQAPDGVVVVDGDPRLVLRVGPEAVHAHRRQVRVLGALSLALLAALPPTAVHHLVLKFGLRGHFLPPLPLLLVPYFFFSCCQNCYLLLGFLLLTMAT